MAESKDKTEVTEKASVKIEDEAKSLGITSSKVSMTGFKDNKPEKVEKEKERHKKLVAKRLASRIAKAKATAKMKPIDKRKAVLVARFKVVKSRTRPNTYTDANIKAWLEEYNMINNNPKAWNKITKNGTVGFVPGNKKKKTAKDILNGMDLEDEE